MQLSDRIGCRLKLHDLHVLMAVVHAGSMSKAAGLLNTGQPAISRSIADLERALGVRLLDRSRMGVKPTDYGRALLEGGTAAFDDLHQAVKNIAHLRDPTIGELKVGCNPFLAASFVSTAIDRFSRSYPRVEFRLVTAYSEALRRELRERHVDVLITRRSSQIEDKRLDFELLFEDTYSVAVGAFHPLSRRRKISLADLKEAGWVLPPPDSTLGTIVAEAFRRAGYGPPRPLVIGEPADVRVALLATGRFVSIFTDSFLRVSPARRDLVVLRVQESLGRMPVGIVTLKDRTITPIAKPFIECTRQLAGGLPRVTMEPQNG